jgi:hypothetical protein
MLHLLAKLIFKRNFALKVIFKVAEKYRRAIDHLRAFSRIIGGLRSQTRATGNALDPKEFHGRPQESGGSRSTSRA